MVSKVTTIINLLKTVSFGSKFFEVVVTLREALLINGMLTSAEIWYGMKKKEINELEEVDKILLRKVLNAPSSSCTESLYLELGLIPLHVILKARRINYLHYLVNLNEEEMLAKFFKIQCKYPYKEDWTKQVQEDLEVFGLDNDLEKIKTTSKNSFKSLVKLKPKNLL